MWSQDLWRHSRWLDEQIKRLDKRIEQIAAQFYPQTMLIQQIAGVNNYLLKLRARSGRAEPPGRP